MRRCKHCKEIMDYDCLNHCWRCSACGWEIKKVIKNGDRFLDAFEEYN